MKLFLNKIAVRLKGLYMMKFGPVVRTLRTPPLPRNPDGKVLLHIGCGDQDDPRYINLDARAMPHVHKVTQSLDLMEFASDSLDLIYACHVLEHVSHLKLKETLSRWRTRLKPGGVLRLAVPDFDTIVQIYGDQHKSIDAVKLALLGGQEYPFNYHYSIFNLPFLRELLKESGFSVVRPWDPAKAPYYSFHDWASADFKIGEKRYPISLNLEGVR